MAENMKEKLLSDEELAKAISLANKKFVESLEISDSESAQAWESIMMDFLREQRSRDDQYTNQTKESKEFEYQKNHEIDEFNLKRETSEREWKKFWSTHELEGKKFEYQKNHEAEELSLKRVTDDRDWEKFKTEHDFEERKLKFEGKKLWFEAGKIFATICATAGGVYAAWANLKAKKIEYSTKSDCWHAICQFEDEGEIVKRQAGQQIKL